MPKKAAAPAKSTSPKAGGPTFTIGGSTPSTPARRRGTAPGLEPVVTVKSDTGATFKVPFGRELRDAALEWSRVVRNRARWSAQPEMRQSQAENSRQVLRDLKVKATQINNLEGASVVQVSIPFLREDVGWEARVFPWEYILSAALPESYTGSLVIVRHLQREATEDKRGSARSTGPKTSPPEKALILQSAPGPLRTMYTFDSERYLVAAKLSTLEVVVLADASLDQARDHIGKISPDVLHLAGFDTHQYLALTHQDDNEFDGYMMVERGQPLAVRSEPLADILVSGTRPVRLAAFNFQNSAARVAAIAVARGVEAAIGFQDRIDDAVAELFFSSFYHYWQDKDWDTFPAFERAFLELQAQAEGLSGSGIILWSARDILPDVHAHRAATMAAAAQPVPAVPAVPASAAAEPDAESATSPARLTTQVAGPPPTPGVASVVSSTPNIYVSVKVTPRVNYSLLHNERPLFETFAIHNNTGAPVSGIEVQATLYAGGDTFPYRRSLEIGVQPAELKNDIRVPLTSALLRGLREATQSVVYVTVQKDRHVLYQDTFRVALVPIEEWSSSDADQMWLPSFVLPRDPAVDEIVQTARAVLRGLRDEATAEFDGYQSVNESADNPYLDLDLQVQALWSTLSFHYNIGYIPPPPTYSLRAQRLRSPSTIMGSKAGTCVDLALLFAACLELIEIYPVVLLFDGHASVGYWRGAALHKRFYLVKPPKDETLSTNRDPDSSADPGTAADDSSSSDTPGGDDTQAVPWLIRRSSKERAGVPKEIRQRVPIELVLLEATLIPKHLGFKEAKRDGADRLDDKVFRTLVDIELARRNGVTPLPIEQQPQGR
jgi:hypothetical protein